MTTIAMTLPRPIRMPKAAQRTFIKPGYLNRFRHFIETSCWDETILAYSARLDRVCQGVLIAAVFCFIPFLLRILLR